MVVAEVSNDRYGSSSAFGSKAVLSTTTFWENRSPLRFCGGDEVKKKHPDCEEDRGWCLGE